MRIINGKDKITIINEKGETLAIVNYVLTEQEWDFYIDFETNSTKEEFENAVNLIEFLQLNIKNSWHLIKNLI